MKLSIRERLGGKTTSELRALWVRMNMPGSKMQPRRDLIIYLRQHLESPKQWFIIAGGKPEEYAKHREAQALKRKQFKTT